MKTLFMLETGGQEKELPSFAEAFVIKKQISLEQLLGMQDKRKRQEENNFGIKQYEYMLVKKENYEFFLFVRMAENFQYNLSEGYPSIGIALRIGFYVW